MTDTNHVEDVSNMVPAGRLEALRESIDIALGTHIGDELLNDPNYDKAVDAIMQAFGRETDRLLAEILAKKKPLNRSILPKNDTELVEYAFNDGFNKALNISAALIGCYKREGTE